MTLPTNYEERAKRIIRFITDRFALITGRYPSEQLLTSLVWELPGILNWCSATCPEPDRYHFWKPFLTEEELQEVEGRLFD